MHTDGTDAATAAQRPVADLYAALTGWASREGPASANSLSIHQGLWGADTRTGPEGVARAVRTLVRGCRLAPGAHLLDAGCGVGGTAIALAETHGVRVTGLTNCAPHAAVAARKARERGVADLVEFVHGDFMELPFADAGFDAVLNQESFCYARDKPAYLRGVFRVLKPGGRWQALDAFPNGAPMPETHRSIVAAVRQNWRLPPFAAWPDALATIADAGFAAVESRDLTAEALRWREGNRRRLTALLFLNPRLRETHPTLVEFMDGSVCFAQGLSEGVFTYRLLSATRPVR